MGTVLWGLAGLAIGGGVALLGGVAAAAIFGIPQTEGAYAMGLAFFWIPLGAVAGAIAGAVFGARRR